MRKINDKLYNWASMLDMNAQLQAERTARLPIVERVALMPDAHLGMGATVGSVIATNGAVIPAAVGVDIGCGMAAVEFDLTADGLPDDLEAFLPMVERAIPAGVGQGHDDGTNTGRQWLKSNLDKFTTDLRKEKLDGLAINQLGSLGSGNHFFEVCLDERDHVWIVLHSGSRGIGNKLASRHIKDAKALAADRQTFLEDKDLAYFTEQDEGFDLYIGDMLACQDWAMANRQLMLKRALAEFMKFMGRTVPVVQTINCHHNFTQKEIHEGREVWVTRKGAIKADVGDKGIIPGSMGTRSYIVSGLGNSDAFCSCSHGAGRIHSRSAAKKLFTEQDLETAMEGKVWNRDSATALVDEIPQAYKDIDVVMKDQEDLVSTDHVLRQILNMKGQ
jgi:RNA-splicing ligase RtcB